MKRIVFAVIGLLTMVVAANAADVTLAWDAVVDSRVTGYNLYYGTTTKVYGPAVPTGKVTQFTLTGVADTGNLFFAVTAFSSTANLESPYSTELPAWTLVPTAGANGSISPSVAKVVSAITPQTFTITPNAGYGILDVKVDGASVGKVASYTFDNANASHTIRATFVAIVPLPAPGGLRMGN